MADSTTTPAPSSNGTSSSKPEVNATTIMEMEEQDGDVTAVECSFHGEFLANPFDCSKFFRCIEGQVVVFQCPDGLEFNSELDVCDWPDNANCQEVGLPSPTTMAPGSTEGPTDAVTDAPTTMAPGSTEEPTNAPTTMAPGSTEGPTDAPSTMAPGTTEEPTDAPTTMAPGSTEEPTDVPTNSPTTMAPGSTNSPTDVPTTIVPGSTVGPTDAPTTMAPGSTEGPTDAPTDAPTSTAAGSTEGATDAPLDEDLDVDLCGLEDYARRDPSDCGKYFACIDGVRHHMTCPGGFLFNEETMICASSDNVSCGDGDDSPTTVPVPTTEAPTTTTPTPTTTESPIATTEEEEEEEESLDLCGLEQYIVRDPSDCAKYYECVDGVSVPAECPEGLLFSEELQACDLPINVSCDI